MEKEERIRPSLLGADFLHLKREMDILVRLGIRSLHYDVMDGNFVPDISFGEKLFVPLFSRYGKKIDFDVHLMTKDPLRHVRQFYALGARNIAIHYETLNEGMDGIKRVKDELPGLSLSLAFSPETKTSLVMPFHSLFDGFLVMSVVPGKGGQSFMPEALEKIAMLDYFRKSNGLTFDIAVDGGIDALTGKMCIEKGADHLVCGSSFFKAEDKGAFLSLFADGDRIEEGR